MENRTSIPVFPVLKSRVINWLNSMKAVEGGFDYNFSPTSGSSLFTSCFALYILDLFRETCMISEEEKLGWAKYINSFQRKEDGLFYPRPIFHPDKERAVFQATSFCLSALKMLGYGPRYPLSIVNKWRKKESVEDYLLQRGCHLGAGGSGNKAMFQAIFLTHEYERKKDPELLNSINVWFDFHNRHQNHNGYWGNGSRGQLYKGMQNAFHQYVVYEYWDREYPRLDIITHAVLKLQDKKGFFSDLPGGSSCKDYDSLHFLLSGHHDGKVIAEGALINAIEAIKTRWNKDGGFCENPVRPYGAKTFPGLLYFIITGKNHEIRVTRAKEVAREIIKPKKYKSRNWVETPHPWAESTLWDTWFCCMSIAEVLCHFTSDNFEKFKFPDHIGIGYNKYQHKLIAQH
jgi:hypothetical protein